MVTSANPQFLNAITQYKTHMKGTNAHYKLAEI